MFTSHSYELLSMSLLGGYPGVSAETDQVWTGECSFLTPKYWTWTNMIRRHCFYNSVILNTQKTTVAAYVAVG